MADAHGTGAASLTVLFNSGINNRDLDLLASLMCDDHTFTDTEGGVVSGKQDCLDAWRGFFAAFPDYRNVFTSLVERGEDASAAQAQRVVVVVGYSTCSDPRLAGPALWTATVRGTKVAEWRVYADTRENRELLAIPT